MAPERAEQVPQPAAGRRFDRGEPARPAGAAPRRDPHWRDDVLGVAGLNIVAGIWLILSPWILGYRGDDAAWNPIICGAIILVLAAARYMSPARTTVLSAVNAAVAVWLFISGFWLAASGQAKWNVWIVGVIVFILSVIGLTARSSVDATP